MKLLFIFCRGLKHMGIVVGVVIAFFVSLAGLGWPLLGWFMWDAGTIETPAFYGSCAAWFVGLVLVLGLIATE